MNRSFFSILLFLALLLLGSCIDEYNADLPASDKKLLVVEGNINSNQTCTFYLSRTTDAPSAANTGYFPEGTDGLQLGISNAQVSVCGDDGSVLPGTQYQIGAYQVQVGTLRSDVRYWLRVEHEGEVFTSEPQYPLDAEQIEDLRFVQNQNGVVSILVTSQAPADGEPRYYRWECDEYWEIHTPFMAEYEYDPTENIIRKPLLARHTGWCSQKRGDVAIASSSQFQGNHIDGQELYSLWHTDDRLNTLYLAVIRQRRISRAEYEYENLRQKLTSDMGSLFSPMPAELPTNIHSQTGKRRAIGYVGVSGKVGTKNIIIHANEVNYTSLHKARTLNEEETAGVLPSELYKTGFRLITFDESNPFKGDGPFPINQAPNQVWASRWCVDCTDPLWGASLKKPEVWTKIFGESPVVVQEAPLGTQVIGSAASLVEELRSPTRSLSLVEEPLNVWSSESHRKLAYEWPKAANKRAESGALLRLSRAEAGSMQSIVTDEERSSTFEPFEL